MRERKAKRRMSILLLCCVSHTYTPNAVSTRTGCFDVQGYEECVGLTVLVVCTNTLPEMEVHEIRWAWRKVFFGVYPMRQIAVGVDVHVMSLLRWRGGELYWSGCCVVLFTSADLSV